MSTTEIIPSEKKMKRKMRRKRKVPSSFSFDQMDTFLKTDDVKSLDVYPLTKRLLVSLVRAMSSYRNLSSLPKDMDDEGYQKFASVLVKLTFDTSREEGEAEPIGIEQSRVIWDEGLCLARLQGEVDASTRKLWSREPYTIGADDNLIISNPVKASIAQYRERQKRSWLSDNKDPFQDKKFQHDPSDFLELPRINCKNCTKCCSLYCARCVVPVLPEGVELPRVELPVHFDLIYHRQEKKTKSTGVQACLLAPNHCRLIELASDVVPEYDPSTTVVLYPTDDAKYLDDPDLNLSEIETIVVIESKWQQGKQVIAHPNLELLPKIRIRQHESTFWRYQELGNQFLSTLEAIYWTSVEYFSRQQQQQIDRQQGENDSEPNETITDQFFMSCYDGHFDDLMFLYAITHMRISKSNTPKIWKHADKKSKLF